MNLALLGAGRRNAGGVATWAAEHQAVLGACRRLQLDGRDLHVLPVDARAQNSVGLPEGVDLVSTSVANNEVGTLQPRPTVPGSLLHLDACQGPQWLEIDLTDVHFAAFSGHKLGAGSGGLLFVRDGVLLEPLQYGGPQERGRRAGLEDVRSATAIAVALEICVRERRERAAAVTPLAAMLSEALVAAGGQLTGGGTRLPNHASAIFEGIRGEDLLLALDLAGVAASSGSACASGSLDPSHVLLAMGFSLEQALCSLRLTCGYETTLEEVERAAEIVVSVVGRLARTPA